jgi:cyanophycinase-like exopeptidase
LALNFLGYAAQQGLDHSFDFRGVNYTAWAAEEYATPASDASLSLLKILGVNWVAILVTEYMDTKNSTEIYADKALTPSETSLIHVVPMAHSQGLNVMLKLHVDP